MARRRCPALFFRRTADPQRALLLSLSLYSTTDARVAPKRTAAQTRIGAAPAPLLVPFLLDTSAALGCLATGATLWQRTFRLSVKRDRASLPLEHHNSLLSEAPQTTPQLPISSLLLAMVWVSDTPPWPAPRRLSDGDRLRPSFSSFFLSNTASPDHPRYTLQAAARPNHAAVEPEVYVAVAVAPWVSSSGSSTA
jgi:hypothetical protein